MVKDIFKKCAACNGRGHHIDYNPRDIRGRCDYCNGSGKTLDHAAMRKAEKARKAGDKSIPSKNSGCALTFLLLSSGGLMSIVFLIISF